VSVELQSDSEYDIAHVLCTDIVGYSKLMIDQQSEYLRKLNDVVRATEQFKRADAAGKLLRIPTVVVPQNSTIRCWLSRS
jgi:hypothetical protein